MKMRMVWAFALLCFLTQASLAWSHEIPGEICASALSLTNVDPVKERSKLFDVLMNDYSYFLREEVISQFCSLMAPGKEKGITFRNSDEARRIRVVNALIEKTSPFKNMETQSKARILRRGSEGVFYVEETFPAVPDSRTAKQLESLSGEHFQSVVYEFLLAHEDFFWKANAVGRELSGGQVVGLSWLGTAGVSLPLYFMGHIHAIFLAPLVIVVPIISTKIKDFLYRRKTAKPLMKDVGELEASRQKFNALESSSTDAQFSALAFPAKKLADIEVLQKLVPLFDLDRPTTLLDFGGDLGREVFNFTHALNSRLFKKGSTAPYLALREALKNILKLAGSPRTVSVISDHISEPLQGLQKLARGEAEENLEYQEVHKLLTEQIQIYHSYLEEGKLDSRATSNPAIMDLLNERETAVLEYGKTLAMAGENLQSERFQILVLRLVSEKMMQVLMRRLSDASSGDATGEDFAKLAEFQKMLEGI